MNIISGATQLFGIIGDPVFHSLSPLFWNAAFSKIGTNAVYVPFRVSSHQLGEAVRGLVALSIKGFNVTRPHKERIVNLLPKFKSPAQKLGAVNTVRVHPNGELEGANTDASGFLAILNQLPIPKKAMILGAGGAAKAVFWGLCESRVNMIYWANRTPGKTIKPENEAAINVVPILWEEKKLTEAISDSDMVINTTSLGWYNNDRFPPLKGLHKNQMYIDLNYNPQSSLLLDAQTNGAQVLDGRELLIQQGVKAFEFLTDNIAPQEVIRASVIEYLAKEPS